MNRNQGQTTFFAKAHPAHPLRQRSAASGNPPPFAKS